MGVVAMVNKQCVACQQYFQGELNGDYLCPTCAAAGRSQLRPQLGPLSGLDSVAGGERRPAAADPELFSKSQAA